MIRKTFTLLGMLIFLLTTHCAKETNPVLVDPGEEHRVVEPQATGFEFEFNPMVDVLFLIDHSASMIDEQQALSESIDQFIAAIAKNELIDFHIAVTTVWDDPDDLDRRHQFLPILGDPEGDHIQLRQGGLLPLKAPVASADSAPQYLLNQPHYVTRQTTWPGYDKKSKVPAYSQILASTLKVGVQPYYPTDGRYGGPYIEQIFSPLLRALNHPLPADIRESNQGFYRHGAHLVVIILSDANDSSPNLTAGQLKHFLDQLKGSQDNYSTYAALSRGEKSCDDSKRIEDYPIEVERFISISNNTSQAELEEKHIFDICSQNYGPKLAAIGKDIKEKVFEKVIPIELPEIHGHQWEMQPNDPSPTSGILVEYGSHVILPKTETTPGWQYIPDLPGIVIDSETAEGLLKVEPGAGIKIRYIPVNTSNILNGKAVPNNGD